MPMPAMDLLIAHLTQRAPNAIAIESARGTRMQRGGTRSRRGRSNVAIGVPGSVLSVWETPSEKPEKLATSLRRPPRRVPKFKEPLMYTVPATNQHLLTPCHLDMVHTKLAEGTQTSALVNKVKSLNFFCNGHMMVHTLTNTSTNNSKKHGKLLKY